MSSRHPLGGGVDPLGIAPAGLAENIPVIFEQGGTEAAQRSQRGAQVMGDRVGERLQVPVGPLKVVHPAAKLVCGAELHGDVPGDRRCTDQRPVVVVDS